MIKRKVFIAIYDIASGNWNPSIDEIMESINEIRKKHHIINIQEMPMSHTQDRYMITVYYYFMGEDTE